MKKIGEKVNIVSISAVVIASMLMTNIAFATSISLSHAPVKLVNHDGVSSLEDRHIDQTKTISRYEYEEKLERGKLKREIEYEASEDKTDFDKDIIEQTIKTPNYNGIDVSNRTNFLSNDDKSSSTFQINVFDNTDDFYYRQQLPPAVKPGDPKFNEFDFRTGLLEFEFELEGWTTEDPINSTYEVLIMMDEVFGDDGSLDLSKAFDIASFGSLKFDSKADSDGRYNFEFEFEQYELDDIYFISDEIYQAIADGTLGIHIARTSGAGNLFLSESELELEKPSVVPAPPAFILFGSALLFLFGSKRSFRKTA